jgi:hypothetical protein
VNDLILIAEVEHAQSRNLNDDLSAAPSTLLLLSVAADLLDEAHGLREYGDWGAVSIEAQARQVLAEVLDRVTSCDRRAR